MSCFCGSGVIRSTAIVQGIISIFFSFLIRKRITYHLTKRII